MQHSDNNNFFQSDVWLSILNDGLGAELFDCTIKNQEVYRAAIFCKGPFRIIYPGFPVGDVPSYCLSFLLASEKMEAPMGKRWQLLRLWQSSVFEQWKTNKKPSSWIPETVITDLSAWSVESLSPSIRRNIKKAYKSDLKIESAIEKDANSLFGLYRKMILQKKGEIRYTQNYFKELIKKGKGDPDLQINIARTSDGVLASMLVCVHHKGNAFYLHGATDEKYSHMRPADLLMFDAIQFAHKKNLKSFSFLPSPINQPGLIKFKEKWGGTTVMTPVFDCYQYSIGAAALRLAFAVRHFLLR